MIRDELPFGEVPIRLFFRSRESNDRRDDIDQSIVRPSTEPAPMTEEEEEAWLAEYEPEPSLEVYYDDGTGGDEEGFEVEDM